MDTPAPLTSAAAAIHRHELLIIHSNWQIFLLRGILVIVLGLLAVVAPTISTLGVEQLVGWLCIVCGFMWTSRIIRRHKHRGFWWRLSSSAVAMTLGVLLVRSPARGAATLTIVTMAVFVITGVVAIVVGLRSAPNLRNWIWTPGGGLVTLMFAYLMWEQWPNTPSWAIGVCAGIIMIYWGTRLIFRVISARSIEDAKA